MHFLRNKQEESEKACEKRGDGYQADNEEDAPYYQMPDGNSQEGFMPFRKQAPESCMLKLAVALRVSILYILLNCFQAIHFLNLHIKIILRILV